MNEDEDGILNFLFWYYIGLNGDGLKLFCEAKTRLFIGCQLCYLEIRDEFDEALY